jgi:hypothetical protein
VARANAADVRSRRFERFVLELGEDRTSPAAPPDMEKLVALAAEYKIDILGPLPEEAGAGS